MNIHERTWKLLAVADRAKFFGMEANLKRADLSKLTPRERHTKILVREAAELAGMSESAFRKHFDHLIRKLTPRCHRVEFGDAITLPPKD